MASVEVLVGPERRRRWSVEQKQAIVRSAFGPGAVVRDVARQADVTPSLIYRWRGIFEPWRMALLRCWYRRAQVLVPPGSGAGTAGLRCWYRRAQVLVPPAGDGIAVVPVPAIEIEFAGNARVRIPASVSPALAAAVVEALARR